MDIREFGFLRCAAVAPQVYIGAPERNAEELVRWTQRAADGGASIVLFPELSLVGYSCEDLFFSRALQEASARALETVRAATTGHSAAVVVGAPLALPDGRLLNCAVVLAEGRILGAVPKIQLPNHGEFYDGRWFASGRDVDIEMESADGHWRVSARQLFVTAGVSWALEICEDLWSVQPPGAEHVLAGAELILNPSASNELVSKAGYRRDLVRLASAQRLCGYLYASAGPSESSKDVVYGGHLMAAENGVMLAEGERFLMDGNLQFADFDAEHLRHDRQQNAVFRGVPRPHGYHTVPAGAGMPIPALAREVPAHPFVPQDEEEFDARAREILAIQATGLLRRMRAARAGRLVIGISGGLDSTLAFLVCLEALRRGGLASDALCAVTLPGPATGERTLAAARGLAAAAEVGLQEIAIGSAVEGHLADIGHDGTTHDVTFENAQARERTQVLFDLANQQGGILVGTGDLSELALGWCTYNADHMSSYNVNVSVPKTMIAYLVRWYARHLASPALGEVLGEVLEIPISPELVPGEESDGVAQHTEAIIGPYELHDFFLYHYVRYGAPPPRIAMLAQQAFGERYSTEEITGWLAEFLRRFHSQQFKRTALPPGPKVGTVSLSPRGDWRMPDESEPPSI